MEWRDQGVLLSVRPHGETSAIIEVFTAEHGRHLGVVRGGVSRKIAPILQPGAQLDVTWKARLENHLGSYTVEPLQPRAAAVMGDRLALAAMNAVLGLARFSLAERAVYGGFYALTVELLDALVADQGWLPGYVQWELALLDEMGFGLDLSACAVRGVNEDLAFVSPRTGRAVSRGAAGEWVDRLLPLPPVLTGGEADLTGVLDGLQTTGHFLHARLAPALGDKPLPDARQRFVDALGRQLSG